MNDLSDNRFIAELCGRDELTLNSYMFNRHVPQRQLDVEEFYSTVYGLLAALSFNIHLSGYAYLAGLAVMYLAFDDYDENVAITAISDYYSIEDSYVIAGITELININTQLISTASHLLNTQLYPRDCSSIDDVLQIIGVVFKMYYNFTVDNNKLKKAEHDVAPLQG
ncbi:MAG: hypothetical protein J1G38_03850 [Clostridiales bacterium]|nr:hypothetical protein [Clostridiales bacterium]